MIIYRVSTYLDAGHDMTRVILYIRADTEDEARKMFNRAMHQLGYKRSDYGWITITTSRDARN